MTLAMVDRFKRFKADFTTALCLSWIAPLSAHPAVPTDPTIKLVYAFEKRWPSAELWLNLSSFGCDPKNDDPLVNFPQRFFRKLKLRGASR